MSDDAPDPKEPETAAPADEAVRSESAEATLPDPVEEIDAASEDAVDEEGDEDDEEGDEDDDEDGEDFEDDEDEG